MIPVLRPKLPEAERVLPYLKQVDANRWYSNYGPLVEMFELRVAEVLHAAAGQALMAANGTLALTLALQALNVARGGCCLMPSWTFTATPAAAIAAGLYPYFMDVDHITQALSPAQVKIQLENMQEKVGAVIAVAPYGEAMDVAEWDRFTQETGIPVVIDAAAGFDALASGVMTVGQTPVMVSLHATKVAGIGEGGLVLTQNENLMSAMRACIQFGFRGERLSHHIGINAKASEYHAAVGLAMLDGWPHTRQAWQNIQQRYRDKFSDAGIGYIPRSGCVSSVFNVILPQAAFNSATTLEERGIDTRRWWEAGCHTHPAYRRCKTNALPVTEWLGKSVLGIPMAIDLSPQDQDAVCNAVIEIAMHLARTEEYA